MDSVLRSYLGKFIVVFLDDILIYRRSPQEHLEHLRKVFDLLRESKLYAKESKCDFFKTKIHYLGHMIFAEGLKMDPAKIEVILQWPHPRNVEELQILLGMAGFYRKLIRDYAKITIPMTDQLKAQGPVFKWDEAQQSSFNKLRLALATAPFVSHSGSTQTFCGGNRC